MAQQSARTIIDARGGYRAVAAALSTPDKPFPPTTVHSWWRANKLPRWRKDAVMAIPVVGQDTSKPTREATAERSAA